MKFKSSFFLSLIFVLGAFSSMAQYKFDVGVRLTTYELETFQFDARYHLKSPYSFVASFVKGSRNRSNYNRTPIYEDSLVGYTNSSSRSNNHSFKLGVQRRLGFFETDVFYAGAALGLGYQTYSSSNYSGVYVIDSIVMNPNPVNYTTDLFSTETYYNTRTLSTELTMTFGMDVPITKRFAINAEIGLITAYRNILKSSNYFFDQHLYVSGGLRYSFGKRNE